MIFYKDKHIKRIFCGIICVSCILTQTVTGFAQKNVVQTEVEDVELLETTAELSVTGLGAGSSQANVQSNASATSADVVVFAYFSDDTAESASEYFNDQGNYATFKDYFMGSSGRAFTNYMSSISYGKYTVNVCMPQEQTDGNIVPIQLPVTQAEAKSSNVDAQIIGKIIEAMPSLSNFSVDRNSDGYIDNITIICKAENCSSSEEVASGASLVAHSNNSGNQGTIQGYGVCNYNIISSDRLAEAKSSLIAHEYLHTLGYPDLYRTDGSKDYPVYIWDIMGSVGPTPNYPLAYLRSSITHWFDISTISESGTYTLNSQKNSTGNKAFILKSPMNDTEFFVVEYRQKPADITDTNSLDRLLLGSGIIVYRVNTTVYELSNAHGGTGIYVFRPQAGQNGYNSSYVTTTVANAFLSSESGRTSIGSADFSATLAEGALTFSDGTNSGIVICEVGSAAGDTIDFKVTFPDLSQVDLWENTDFPSSCGGMNEQVTIVKIGDSLYTVEYDGAGFTVYKYLNNQWQSCSSKLNVSSNSYNGQMKLFEKSGNLYLAYGDWDAKLYLKTVNLSTNSWSNVTTMAGAGEYFDVAVIGADVYLSYGDSSLKLAKLDGTSFSAIGSCYTSSWLMGATNVLNVDGMPYIFGRDASGNSIVGYKYNGTGFEKITDGNIAGNTFDLLAYNGKIYVAYTANDTNLLQLAVYDGTSWSITQSQIDSSDVAVCEAKGNIYVLSSPSSGEDSFKMYLYKNATFVQEGDTVIDSASSGFSVLSNDDNLFLSYVRAVDKKAFVKTKKLNQSNSSTPTDECTQHSYSTTWSTDGTNHWHVCTVCGATTDTAAHAGGTATCKKTAKCASCGVGYGTLASHSYSTAWSTGGTNHWHECTVCGDKKDWGLIPDETVNDDSKNEIPSNEIADSSLHEHTLETAIQKATCTTDGTIETKCTVCGTVTNVVTIFAATNIKLSTSTFTYNGKVKTPTVAVYDAAGNKIDTSNYSVTYAKGRKNVGAYKVTIWFKNSSIYSGSKNLTFKINPPKTSISSISAKHKLFTVKWKKKTTQVTGYQIQYSVSKKFASGNKTLTIKSAKTTSTTVKKLKAKKKYYIRIRTYKKVGKTNFYSDWSVVKSVITK